VSEISALGIPAVYVPYAVGNGEQAMNAASSVSAGAAVLIPDAEFTPERVRGEVVGMLRDRERLDAMRAAADGVGTRRGSENVVALIDETLGR
jgi:UDP-N-acetylglucosamine--N-acetylmuramyl-(pentapeptide) pyrophosphoryl-undecaprenol N-acetylglucosamine transferase